MVGFLSELCMSNYIKISSVGVQKINKKRVLKKCKIKPGDVKYMAADNDIWIRRLGDERTDMKQQIRLKRRNKPMVASNNTTIFTCNTCRSTCGSRRAAARKLIDKRQK
ncbi:hypothetical protein ATANTOWER_003543 [Ataeniobius toweri]|uniref:Uncharacterized protein n=1 Tax=Ataeniobius toweri TaxID=208326 RepID=A0ABU7AY91_9TELE|nr:hypothetical protein [Ataeniobius toweri]